jgi:uncharacterized protein YjbI with pentapeptide repeats
MLAHINLRNADLYAANFWKAHLDNANLGEADLSNTRIRFVYSICDERHRSYGAKGGYW